MATISRPSTSLPVAGGDMNSEPITDHITNIMSFIEGHNSDEDNVNLTATNGLLGKSTAQTITGQKTVDATLILTGTYAKPLRIGSTRIWEDSATGALMAKHGSDPSSATDGNIIMEATA